MNALERAVAALGGQSSTARAAGVSQAAVNYWLKRSRLGFPMPPAEFCRVLEKATAEKGEIVTCEELRPDVFGMAPTEAAA